MRADWIKSIPDYERFFTPEEREMIAAIGIDNFIALLEKFAKTSFYFSNKSINDLRKRWVVINKNVPYDEAARILGVSVSSIYNWRDEKNTDNLSLFNED